MYVKPGCPYCAAAREDLAAKGEQVEERDATVEPGWKAELMRYTANTGVVPTIVRADGGERQVQVGFPPGRG
jgi:glutaredoxin